MLEYDYGFFYWGEPVKTPIGEIEFKKVKDYPEVAKHLAVLKGTDKISILKLLMKSGNVEFARLIEPEPFLDTMMILEGTALYTQYVSALEFFLGKNLVDRNNPIVYTDADLYDYLELIYHMNASSFPKRLTGNPEIDRFIEYERRLQQKMSGNITLESLTSSVAVHMGIPIEQLKDIMTIYQLHVDFYRIGQFKAFDVTTMYRMMDNKVELVEWNKHVDILESLSKKEKTLEEASREGRAKFT